MYGKESGAPVLLLCKRKPQVSKEGKKIHYKLTGLFILKCVKTRTNVKSIYVFFLGVKVWNELNGNMKDCTSLTFGYQILTGYEKCM